MSAGSRNSEFPARRRAVTWLAFSLGAGGFFLILPSRGLSFSLQYSIVLVVLTMLCLRWLTRPVHPGVMGYLSPHTIILAQSLIYFGLGPLPRLAFPGVRIIGSFNLGADEFYLPALLLCAAGLLVFDLVYRWMSRSISLNGVLRAAEENFSSPRTRGSLPLLAFFWYFLCLGIFLYMTRRYVMVTFDFVGVEGARDNIFLQSGFWLVGTAWVMLSLLLFEPGSAVSPKLILLLLVLLLPVMVAYQVRRQVAYCLGLTLAAYYVYPHRVFSRKALVWGTFLIFAGFIMFTSVKYATRTDPALRRQVAEERNVFLRTWRIASSPGFFDLKPVDTHLRQSLVVRLNGLDWAAAMMEARSRFGASFLRGRHNLEAFALYIPRVLWPNKPPGHIETTVNWHYELGKFDQLATILGSAYADGGPVGVLAGYGFLGLFFPLAIWLIFKREDGLIVYLGALLPLLSYETYLMAYVALWFRWALIVMILNSAVFFARSWFLPRKERNPGET